ncbi:MULTISPECIES: Pr6Pr family membrane protein [Arthrobacter]|uniref:Pr6Pr family membrane protein n=1 Tax=Arthrobacter TaxID=1663 RepID=UPI001606E796|nr:MULTISPECIES: Pr6Pr family membrane protein [Arthrobacter]QYF88799.1 Pr6Pr family membrane protein [Arthrobacter sp. PAMC25284]
MNIPNRGLALFRFWFAALGLLAVAFQLSHLLRFVPGASAANYFSYFTIESNVIAFTTLAVAGTFAWKGQNPRWLDLLRGAATIYMTITGIVYNLLLSDIDVNTPIPWINVVLHYTIPTIMVIDWLVDLPKTRIALRTSLIWLGFPLLYLVYSLLRGPIVGWYPYPFLDPRISGYGTVAAVSLAIALGACVFAAIAALSTRLHIPTTVSNPAVPRPDVLVSSPGEAGAP